MTGAVGAGAFGREVIQRIARGDEKALAELYDQTSRMIYGLVLRIVRDTATAEEVTLESYMQVWRTASNYKPERESVNAWLVRAARNTALDRLRTLPDALGQSMEVV